MTERKCQHKRALELFAKIGDTVTPEQIDKHVGGTGSYYSKHMSVMRRWGFEFSVKKDGREIISYTLTKEPANAAEYRAGKVSKAKPKKEKVIKVVAKPVKAPAKPEPVKVAKAAAKVTKKAAKPETKKVAPKATKKVEKKTVDAKASNLEKLKAVAEKRKEERAALKSAPGTSSFSVDEAFDSMEGVDISTLI